MSALSYQKSDARVRNISQSLTYKMAANSWHIYDMKKLRDCHPMYTAEYDADHAECEGTFCFDFVSITFVTAHRNARIASAVLATEIPSVCLSVRPSVCHTPVLCQNDGT